MRVGVVGASGFIGSHLINGLSQIHSVRGFSSSISDEVRQIHKGSYTDLDAINQFCNSLDALIYVAGMVNPRHSSVDSLGNSIDSLVGQLDSYLHAFFTLNPKGKFVCFSSSGALYPKSLDTSYNENDSLVPQGDYGRLKQDEEKLVFKKYNNQNIIILRPSNVFGDPYKKNIQTGIVDKLIYSSIHEQVVNIFENQLNQRDYLYIDDVIEAVNLILTNEVFSSLKDVQIFNLSAQVAISLEEVISSVKKYFGDIHLAFTGQEKEKNALFISSEKFRSLTGWAPRYSFESSLQHLKQKLTSQNVKK